MSRTTSEQCPCMEHVRLSAYGVKSAFRFHKLGVPSTIWRNKTPGLDARCNGDRLLQSIAKSSSTNIQRFGRLKRTEFQASGRWFGNDVLQREVIESFGRIATGERLPEVTAAMRPEIAGAATVALKGRVQRSGTKVSASYRWQPRHLVTAVNPYESFSNQAYLSFYVRQAVRWGDQIPQGLEATVDRSEEHTSELQS